MVQKLTQLLFNATNFFFTVQQYYTTCKQYQKTTIAKKILIKIIFNSISRLISHNNGNDNRLIANKIKNESNGIFPISFENFYF